MQWQQMHAGFGAGLSQSIHVHGWFSSPCTEAGSGFGLFGLWLSLVNFLGWIQCLHMWVEQFVLVLLGLHQRCTDPLTKSTSAETGTASPQTHWNWSLGESQSLTQAWSTVPLPLSSCLHSVPTDKGTNSSAESQVCDVVVCLLGSLLRSAAPFGSCSTGQLSDGNNFW